MKTGAQRRGRELNVLNGAQRGAYVLAPNVGHTIVYLLKLNVPKREDSNTFYCNTLKRQK